MERNLEAERSAELFPVVLPPWAVRSWGWLIGLLFLCLAAAAVLVSVSETIVAPVVLVPAGGSVAVQSPVAGVLQQSLVREGQPVREGETLFEIRSQVILDRSSELRIVQEELAGLQRQKSSLLLEKEARERADLLELERLGHRERQLQVEVQEARALQELSRRQQEAALGIQGALIGQYESEADFSRKNLAAYQEVLKRYNELSTKEFIAPIQLLSQQLETSKAELAAELAQRALKRQLLERERTEAEGRNEAARLDLQARRYEADLRETRAGLEKIRQESHSRDVAQAEAVAAVATRIEKARLQTETLLLGLQDSAGAVQNVVAPYAGSVTSVSRKARGDVIAAGQELCRISRTAGELRGEMTIPEQNIAKLRTSQPVRLFLNAFPYQRYGVSRGTVAWISPEATATAEGKAFAALVALQKETVPVDGADYPLRAGMQGTAQITVGRRKLVEFILEPIRQLRENLSGTISKF